MAGGFVRSFDVATYLLRLVEAVFSDPNLSRLRPHVFGGSRDFCVFGEDGTGSIGLFEAHCRVGTRSHSVDFGFRNASPCDWIWSQSNQGLSRAMAWAGELGYVGGTLFRPHGNDLALADFVNPVSATSMPNSWVWNELPHYSSNAPVQVGHE